MAQTTVSNRNRMIILGAVLILTIVVVTFAAITFYPKGTEQTQPQDTYVPQLVMSELQFKDNRTNPNEPFLHLTGKIQNTGNGTANNITLSMYAIKSENATAIDTAVSLEPIQAGATQAIDLEFNYTGDALVAYNPPSLDWTN